MVGWAAEATEGMAPEATAEMRAAESAAEVMAAEATAEVMAAEATAGVTVGMAAEPTGRPAAVAVAVVAAALKVR